MMPGHVISKEKSKKIIRKDRLSDLREYVLIVGILMVKALWVKKNMCGWISRDLKNMILKN